MTRRNIVCGLLTLAHCGAAWSQRVDPNADTQFNWNATTGLVNIPIARSLREGTFFGAFDFKSKNIGKLFGSEFEATSANPSLGTGDQGNGSFNFMFSPLRNVEIGVLGLHDVDRGGNVNTLGRLFKFPPAKDFSTALKWVIAEENQDMPAIAVGVENLTHPRNGDSEPNQRFFQQAFYAVASKSFPIDEDQIFSLHLGAGTGRFQNRPFGGVEYTLSNGLALLAEYDGFRSSVGLRYTGLRNLRATLALQGGRPTFQIGYSVNPYDLFATGDQDDYSPFAKPLPPPAEPPEKVNDSAPPAGDQTEPSPEVVPGKPDTAEVLPRVVPRARPATLVVAAAPQPQLPVRPAPAEAAPKLAEPAPVPVASLPAPTPSRVVEPLPPVRAAAPAPSRPQPAEQMQSSRSLSTQDDDEQPEAMAPSRY